MNNYGKNSVAAMAFLLSCPLGCASNDGQGPIDVSASPNLEPQRHHGKDAGTDSGAADSGNDSGSVDAGGDSGTVDAGGDSGAVDSGASAIQTAFIILLENHNWSQIQGSSSAPYINGALLPQSSYATQYYNPPGIHPSEPNYVWLNAGSNNCGDVTFTTDNDPSAKNSTTTTQHLATLLKNAGVSWKTYQENISGTVCPLSSSGEYAAKHNPFGSSRTARGTTTRATRTASCTTARTPNSPRT
jgi:hypothetical protein